MAGKEKKIKMLLKVVLGLIKFVKSPGTFVECVRLLYVAGNQVEEFSHLQNDHRLHSHSHSS